MSKAIDTGLARQLILVAKALAARPRELRGPFIVNHELVERLAGRAALTEESE